MLNALYRILETEFVPAVSGQEYRAAYCVNSPIYKKVFKPGGYSCSTSIDSNGIRTNCVRTGDYVWTRVGWERICYPEEPYIAAVPAYVLTSQGWDAGALSITEGAAGWLVEFSADPTLDGVLCGIAPAAPRPSTYRYGTCTHGVALVSGKITVVERGRTVATVAEDADQETVVRLYVSDHGVDYTVDGMHVFSSSEPAPDNFVLCGMIYRTGTIYNPVIAPLEQRQVLMESEPEVLIGIGNRVLMLSDPYALFRAMMDGRYLTRVLMLADPMTVLRPTVIRRRSVLMASDPFFRARVALAGGISGSFPAARLIMAQGTGQPGEVYGSLMGMTAPSKGSLRQGVESQGGIGELIALTPKPSMSAIGYVGVYGEIDSQSRPAKLLGSEEGLHYGGIRGAFKPAAGYLLEEAYWDTTAEETEGLLLPDFCSLGGSLVALFGSDSVELSTEVVLLASIDELVTEVIGAADEVTLSQLIQLLADDRIYLDSGQAHADELAEQFITTLTGAITSASGLDFSGYAWAGDRTLAWRRDGVYVFAGSTDDGAAIPALVDFGSTDLGSAQLKYIESVYFGLSTDGDVFMRLQADDGAMHTYRVQGGGQNRRAMTAKGLNGRFWRLQAEFVDATELELFNIEFVVGVSGRRISRRG